MSVFLRAFRDRLQNFIVTSSRDIPLETLSAEWGQVIASCLQILQDTVTLLNSLVELFERRQSFIETGRQQGNAAFVSLEGQYPASVHSVPPVPATPRLPAAPGAARPSPPEGIGS